MKRGRIQSATTGVVLGLSLAVGCMDGAVGVGRPSVDERSLGSLRLGLITNGVTLLEVAYTLQDRAGPFVKRGTIPVPNQKSVVNGFIGAIDPAQYSLTLTATGTFEGKEVACETEPRNFSVSAGEAVTLKNIELICTVPQALDGSGNLSFEAEVTVKETTVPKIGTVSVAPLEIIGSGAYATFDVDENPELSYEWLAAPDGSLNFDDTSHVSGRYYCSSDGQKQLTLLVTDAHGNVAEHELPPLTCCLEDCGPRCGNGVLDPGEACEPPGVGDCSQSCQLAACSGSNCEPPPTGCDGECPPPVCGNQIVESPETCDPPSSTCTTACRKLPRCGDGVVEPPESCELALNPQCRPGCRLPGEFACGNRACTPSTEYCELARRGAPVVRTFACVGLPEECSTEPTCGCLLDAVGASMKNPECVSDLATGGQRVVEAP